MSGLSLSGFVKSVQYSLFCVNWSSGDCSGLEDFEIYENQRAAETYCRSIGWTHPKAGWTCPQCTSKKRQNEKD